MHTAHLQSDVRRRIYTHVRVCKSSKSSKMCRIKNSNRSIVAVTQRNLSESERSGRVRLSGRDLWGSCRIRLSFSTDTVSSCQTSRDSCLGVCKNERKEKKKVASASLFFFLLAACLRLNQAILFGDAWSWKCRAYPFNQRWETLYFR